MSSSDRDTANVSGSMKSPLSRRNFLKIAATAASTAVVAGGLASRALGGPKPPLSTPTVSCSSATTSSITLEVCAGSTGAPAGFTVQWMTKADYDANGSSWSTANGALVCAASFSGNANDSRYVLAVGDCMTVQIGEILFDNGVSTNCAYSLDCDTEYVFRAFAHATNTIGRSAFTADLTCSTAACPETCYALSQGYWRNHTGRTDPDGIPNSGDETYSLWPTAVNVAGGMTIGTVFYSLDELAAILVKVGTGGNQLPQLAHQVIAVQFSVMEYGWAPNSVDVQKCLTNAHTAIGANNVLTGSLKGVGALIDCLDTNYIQQYECGD